MFLPNVSFILLCVFFVCECHKYDIRNVDPKYTMNLELRRHKSVREQLITNGHQMHPELHRLLTKPPRSNDSIALYKFLDNEFYAPIVIGHPGQTLNVALDTSWSYSWVMSTRCSALRMIGCYWHRKYDHDRSSEYKKDGRPFFLNVGSYNLTGFFSYDNISIAHSNVTGQSFIEMVEVPPQFIINKADGIMGLGLKVNEANYTPFFYTLLQQKKIKNPVFSIYLNRDRQSNRGGNVMLGFVDSKHIHKTVINKKPVPDNFTFLNVENHPYWQFQMDKIVVNNDNDKFTVCANGCATIVDTSATMIIGPKEDIFQIHDAIGAKELILNRYTVNCDTINKLPKIDFILGGKNFTLAGPDYTIKLSYDSLTLCLSAFEPANTIQEENRWVLGAAFLAEFYTAYDVQAKTIGFVKASAKNN